MFGDLDPNICPENFELLEMDDMWSEEWDAFVSDDDLIALAAETFPVVEHLNQVDENPQDNGNDDRSEQDVNGTGTSSDDLDIEHEC